MDKGSIATGNGQMRQKHISALRVPNENGSLLLMLYLNNG